jgi:hypothetical protein
MIEWNGRVQSPVEWSRELGIDYHTFRKRLVRWGLERTMQNPPLQKSSLQSGVPGVVWDKWAKRWRVVDYVWRGKNKYHGNFECLEGALYTREKVNQRGCV